jgi:hypothetical protein
VSVSPAAISAALVCALFGGTADVARAISAPMCA